MYTYCICIYIHTYLQEKGHSGLQLRSKELDTGRYRDHHENKPGAMEWVFTSVKNASDSSREGFIKDGSTIKVGIFWYFSNGGRFSVKFSFRGISSNLSSRLWKRTNLSVVMTRDSDLDTANLRPSLEHHDGCGKQTPSTSILFFRANLPYVLNIKI